MLAAFDEAAQGDLWPGFQPTGTPLELFDGQTTWLVRHPAPPEGFEAVAGQPELARFAGQHESVRANTSIELAGERTATVILDGALEPRAQAAVVLHEAFHVFQGEQELGWGANEAELLTYPFDDARNLQLRWQAETGLREALAADAAPLATAWAFSALHTERARRKLLPVGAATYERAIELHEGTAQYIQDLARGESDPWPPEGFGVEDVRRRGYLVGAAIARLLDRYAPGWKERAGTADGTFLDELLLAELERRDAQSVAFGHGASHELRERAQRVIEEYVAGLTAAREEFLAQPGWRVSVRVADSGKLGIEGFDPMNVRRLSAAELLHTRWLRLAGTTGRFEAQRTCLSRGVSEHPLFAGLSELVVAGLAHKPDVTVEGTTVTLHAEGLSASFDPARIEWGENELAIHAGEAP